MDNLNILISNTKFKLKKIIFVLIVKIKMNYLNL